MNIEIDTKNDTPILVFRNKNSDRYYVHGNLESSSVAPGPVILSGFNDDEGDGKFFLFWIADCMSPPMYVIMEQSFEAAYEAFVDWQVEQLKIEQGEENGEDHSSYTSNGVPVDTESVGGEEVFFVASVQWPDDRNLWNLACMFLSRVTRYDNQYDEAMKFRTEMSKCCGPSRAADAWNMARDLRHFTF